MTINLTPQIQSQIYFDKKEGYLLEMVDKLIEKEKFETNENKTESFFSTLSNAGGSVKKEA